MEAERAISFDSAANISCINRLNSHADAVSDRNWRLLWRRVSWGNMEGYYKFMAHGEDQSVSGPVS